MSIVEITYDGDDISDSVLFSSCSFESQLAAVPGSFEFTVRDREQTRFFTPGKEVTMSIDGTRYFGGFVTQVTRLFAFPVDDTTDIESVRTRQWLLRGVDYNILFDKRIIYNKANPNATFPLFPTTDTDVDVLDRLFSDYLDIADDGIDTTTYVEEVADPTPDGKEGAYMNPGDPWRAQMDAIALKTGAIYYIDANKKLHYQQFETVSPSWSFSDAPDRVTSFGFRECEFTNDATNVANDALVWGGSEFGSTGQTARTVFGRSQNTISIAGHGRWQFAEKHFNETGFFETTGVQLRSEVIVFGEPGGTQGGDQSRGLQNPQKHIRLTWFNNTVPTPLTAGSVVDVELTAFGQLMSLPVRTITITFPTPTSVEFQGFLGIQTSDPWSLWRYMKAATARSRTTTPIITSDGSAPAVPGSYVQVEPNPTPDGSNNLFSVPDPYVPGTLEVFLFEDGGGGGLLQRIADEYTESDPPAGEFTMLAVPSATDRLWVRYYST